MLQARFYVLRKDFFLWNKKDVIAVSETYVILHNMLMRMNQDGPFQDEAAQDEEIVNFVTELYDLEWERATERRNESEMEQNNSAFQVDEDGLLDLEAFQIRESILTSSVCFQGLRDDLTIPGKKKGTCESRYLSIHPLPPILSTIIHQFCCCRQRQ